MSIRSITYLASTVLIAAMVAGCTADNDLQVQETYDPVGSVIQFTAGTVATRASIPYMIDDGRFICRMYYHQDVNAHNGDVMGRDSVETWLEVDGDEGKAKYQLGTFPSYTPVSPDYGNPDATKFVWKNRLEHAFVALADYNKLTTNQKKPGGTLIMEPTANYVTCDPNDIANRRYYYNAYDIMNAGYTSMSQQPDPILALTTVIPSAATEEGNRVNLVFQHQLSQVLVNLKNATDESVNIASGDIKSVELLGVAEMAYVTNQVQEIRHADDRTRAWPTFYNPYPVSRKKTIEVPYGSSFKMFEASAPQDGYLKTYECIAYGDLGAIRITWNESANNIDHVVVYPVIESSLTPLKSGMKYIYNIELRRSTISVLRAEILPWTIGETYSIQGTAVPEE